MKFTVNADQASIENFFDAYAAQSLPSAGLKRLIVAYQNRGGHSDEDQAFTRAAAALLLRAYNEMRALEDATYSTAT